LIKIAIHWNSGDGEQRIMKIIEEMDAVVATLIEFLQG